MKSRSRQDQKCQAGGGSFNGKTTTLNSDEEILNSTHRFVDKMLFQGYLMIFNKRRL